MRLRIRNTTLTLQIISWLQIIGGIAGIGLVAYLMSQTGTINGALLLMFLIGVGLFSYSTYSGKRLLTDKKKECGIILSIINQVGQVFQWSMFGYALSYSSGAELAFGVQESVFKFSFSAIISTFKIAINSDNEFLIKINVFAVLVIVILTDILNELKEENREQRIEAQEMPENMNRGE